jgi:arginine deiminase
VVAIKQVLFWTDAQVSRVVSRVVLSSVPLGTPIKQMFELVWANMPPPYDDVFKFDTVNTVANYDNIVSSINYVMSQRSGIYGIICTQILKGVMETQTKKNFFFKKLNLGWVTQKRIIKFSMQDKYPRKKSNLPGNK